MPQRQPKRGRLWLNDGSCIRRQPEYRNHVWAYDFVFDRTHDGRALRLLTIVDEYTRECLAIKVARRLSSRDVLSTLAELFLQKGVPEYIRSDNVLSKMSSIRIGYTYPSGPIRVTHLNALESATSVVFHRFVIPA